MRMIISTLFTCWLLIFSFHGLCPQIPTRSLPLADGSPPFWPLLLCFQRHHWLHLQLLLQLLLQKLHPDNWFCTWTTALLINKSYSETESCAVYIDMKKEEAKRHAGMLQNMPDSCWPGRKSLWSFLTSWMWSQNAECIRHFESVEIDSLWEVPPTKVCPTLWCSLYIFVVLFFVQHMQGCGLLIFYGTLTSGLENLGLQLWLQHYKARLWLQAQNQTLIPNLGLVWHPDCVFKVTWEKFWILLIEGAQ